MSPLHRRSGRAERMASSLGALLFVLYALSGCESALYSLGGADRTEVGPNVIVSCHPPDRLCSGCHFRPGTQRLWANSEVWK